jgi:hypothetical protein
VFGAQLAGVLALAARRRLSLGVRDILLIGVATHKLARIATRDRPTAPLRAPFARYEAPAGAGELKERSRGEGARRAIGELVTCPYCAGPWIASALVAGMAVAPRVTRTLASLFTSVAVSDALQQIYASMKKAS